MHQRILAFFVFLGIVASTYTAYGQNDPCVAPPGAGEYVYWICIPPNEIPPYPVSALEIYVSSAFDTEVTVFDAAGGRTYKRQIDAGEIRTLSDSRGETSWTWEVREYEKPVLKGIRLTADKPLNINVLNGKRFSSDGFYVLPVSAWGKEYVAASFYDFKEFDEWAGGFCVLSQEDGTLVTITLRGEGSLDAATSEGSRIGDQVTIRLDEGEVYCVIGDGQTRGEFDLTGSSISSTKPVGVWGFHQRTTIPNILINGNGRDHLVEMLYPVPMWSNKYVAVGFNREATNPSARGDLFRVIGSEDNTKWNYKYYDQTTKALQGLGGGVLARAGNAATLTQSQGPTVLPHDFSVWEADKPIQVVQYSTSANFDGDNKHDPFMIMVTPLDAFASLSAQFQTPTDTKFLTHNVSLVVWADTSDPDYVDNLKSLEIDDIPVWNHPRSLNPTLLFNHMGDNLHWVTLDYGTEATAHATTANNKLKFSGYVYGFGQVDSYGWPIAIETGNRVRDSLLALDQVPPAIERLSSTNIADRVQRH